VLHFELAAELALGEQDAEGDAGAGGDVAAEELPAALAFGEGAFEFL